MRGLLRVLTVCFGAVLSVAGWGQGGMRQVSIPDPFLGMDAATLSIPAGWTFLGTILRGVGCGHDNPLIVYRAESPDKLTGVQFMPHIFWFAATDDAAMEESGRRSCPQLGEISPETLGRSLVASNVRAGATIVDVQGPADGFLQQQIAALNPRLSQMGSRESGQAARLRLAYAIGGHPVEEWLNIEQTRQEFSRVVAMHGARRMGMTYEISAAVYGLRAPRGQLDANAASLLAVVRSVQLRPQWAQAQQAYYSRTQEQYKSMAAASLRKNQAQADQRNQDMRNFTARLAARSNQVRADNDAQHAQMYNAAADHIDYLAGNQYYLDPSTGEHVTLPATSGGYAVRNDSSYPGQWMELVPVNHQDRTAH